jgi:micrococcal nuclease
MHRSSVFFWVCIGLLFSCSVFFGVSVQRESGKLRSAKASIDSGALVKLVKVVDGDSVMVVQEGQSPVVVRILGIKSFDSKIEKDVVTPFGQAAIQALNRLLADRPVRVLLGATAKDRYSRYIATLFVDDQDIGLRLVKEGLVLVYTVYPFPAMSLYLEQQELARAGRKGLWAHNEVADRALTLAKAWQRQSE